MPLDVLLARLAARQAGVASRAQLLALGFTRREIELLVKSARLIRIHQGVDAVGHHALSDRGRIIAALLAAETTTHHQLPITTPAQAIAQLPPREATGARDEALLLGLIPRTHDDQAEPTRSALERALLPALEQAGLPEPRVNEHVLGHEVDFHWPDHRLIVETDGWRTHGRRRAFEDDRARDAQRHAAGWIVLRFTWRQVIHETLLVVVRIAQVFALSAARATP